MINNSNNNNSLSKYNYILRKNNVSILNGVDSALLIFGHILIKKIKMHDKKLYTLLMKELKWSGCL